MTFDRRAGGFLTSRTGLNSTSPHTTAWRIMADRMRSTLRIVGAPTPAAAGRLELVDDFGRDLPQLQVPDPGRDVAVVVPA
jgi:hypothetical protein